MSDESGRSFALLTPPGVGAIAVMRLSGCSVWSALREWVHSRTSSLPTHPAVDHIYYGVLRDCQEEIDDVILRVVARGAKGSTDGADVVELNCHGGVAVVSRVTSFLNSIGFKRDEGDVALDSPVTHSVIEREVLRLLPRVTTRRTVRFLLRQIDLLPAFCERVLGFLESGDLDRAVGEVSGLLDRSRSARHMYQAPTIAVVGPVNAGKSSLVNKLSGRDAAIAADRPGATLDYVTVEASIDGVAMRLMDTPGSAGPSSEIHIAAQRSARSAAEAADLRLFVIDAGSISSMSPSIWEGWASQGPWLLVVNKIDLAPAPELPLSMKGRVIPVSSLSGEAMKLLDVAILRALGLDAIDANHAVAIGGIIEMLESAIEAPTSEKLASAIRSINE